MRPREKGLPRRAALNELNLPLGAHAAYHRLKSVARDVVHPTRDNAVNAAAAQVTQQVVRAWTAWNKSTGAPATTANVMAFVQATYPQVAAQVQAVLAQAAASAAGTSAANTSATAAPAMGTPPAAAPVGTVSADPQAAPSPETAQQVAGVRGYQSHPEIRNYQNKTMREIMDALKQRHPDQANVMALVKELLAHGREWSSVSPAEQTRVQSFLKYLQKNPEARRKIPALRKFNGMQAESFVRAVGLALHLVEHMIFTPRGLTEAYQRFFLAEAPAAPAVGAAPAAPAPVQAPATAQAPAPVQAPAQATVFTSAQLMRVFQAVGKLLTKGGHVSVGDRTRDDGADKPAAGPSRAGQNRPLNAKRMAQALQGLSAQDQHRVEAAAQGARSVRQFIDNMKDTPIPPSVVKALG